MSKREPGLWRVGFDFNLRGSAEEFLASVTTGRGWQGRVRRLNPKPVAAPISDADVERETQRQRLVYAAAYEASIAAHEGHHGRASVVAGERAVARDKLESMAYAPETAQ